MSRQSRSGLRQAIIQASLELGQELGEEGLTMRGIASRLGVSATALYQHFESKASILREIRIYGAELLAHEVTEPCAGVENPCERIKRMGELYINFARARPWLYTVMMQSEQLDWSTMNDDEIERTLRPLTTLRAWIREGSEKGCWRPGLDPEVASFRLWAAFHGICSMLISGRIDEEHPAFPVASQAEFVKSFVDGVIDGLTCAPPA